MTTSSTYRVGQKMGQQTSNKPFFIWLLTTPPHLKYVTLPCNLSLIACFVDINLLQGSVTTYARCGGSCNICLTTNLLRNLPVNFFSKIGSDLTELCSRVCGPTFSPTLYIQGVSTTAGPQRLTRLLVLYIVSQKNKTPNSCT